MVIADAINAAADNDICKIINMSFGTQNSDVLTDSIEYAVSKGKIVVAAAGNYSSTTLYYPASYENVISVGSVGADGVVSDFSQKNSGIDVTAPGENIYVYSVSGELKQASGTSFSTPEVAALTACMLELDPTLDFDGIYSLLTSTADDKGDAGRDNSYGYGIVNPSAIAERLKEFAVLFGDVDGDGKITPADEILLARSLAGMTGYTFDYKKRADINFDGEITPSDHIALARKIAGWSGYETLPMDQ